MQIAILGLPQQHAAWACTEGHELTRIQSPEEAPAGALIIDLQYDGTEVRASQLRAHKGPVWINDVCGPSSDTLPFVRINGWSGFEAAPQFEACAPEALRADAEAGAAALGKSMIWLPDTPGFVTPRVIAMVINEAYHALAEGVSGKAEINTAMKLGTAYPYGPFEWATRIGLKNVAQLLLALEKENARYAPNALLLQEADL